MTTPVNRITGIGPKTAAFLTQHGIETAEALLQADIAILAAAPGFSLTRAGNVLQAARALSGSGLPAEASVSGEQKKKKQKTKDKGKKTKKSKKEEKKDKAGKKKKKKKDKKNKEKKKKK